MIADPEFRHVLLAVLGVLATASILGQLLRRFVHGEAASRTITNLNARIRSWWLMVALFAGAMIVGSGVTVAFFCLVSFLAFREFITLAPTRTGDRLTLFMSFFLILPLQYALVGIGWYGLFAVMIPVYAFVAMPAVAALAGETQDFTARAARLQFGLLLTIYALSNAPALLMLHYPSRPGLSPALVLLFLIVVVQASDVCQYIAGKLLGRTRLAPSISPNKTLEGLLGGGAAAIGCGVLLRGLTPFSLPAAAALSAVIVLTGFLGGLALSAMKRDLGVKDWGSAIGGHGGILDRMDSVCFAAPVFFHVTRYFYT